MDTIVQPWTGPDGNAAFYRQIAQASSDYTDDVQPLYCHLAKPVLILWGREDTWIPLEKGEILHDMISSSILKVIPDAGHFVIEEQPDEVLRHINAFLH